MDNKTNRRLRVLEVYSVGITVLVVTLIVSGFVFEDKQRFKEIDVGRINVVESDGRLRMTISNKQLAPDPIIRGKTYPLRSSGNDAGIIFFNDEGTECGGLAFGGSEKNGKYEAASSLTMDQFNQDQTVGLQYSDSNGARSAGLRVWDRGNIPLDELLDKYLVVRKMKDGPEKDRAMTEFREAANRSGAAQRIFVGKSDPDKTAQIVMSDPQGKPRLKLVVDGSGNPSLAFLDADGKVIYSLPDRAK